ALRRGAIERGLFGVERRAKLACPFAVRPVLEIFLHARVSIAFGVRELHLTRFGEIAVARHDRAHDGARREKQRQGEALHCSPPSTGPRQNWHSVGTSFSVSLMKSA